MPVRPCRNEQKFGPWSSSAHAWHSCNMHKVCKVWWGFWVCNYAECYKYAIMRSLQNLPSMLCFKCPLRFTKVYQSLPKFTKVTNVFQSLPKFTKIYQSWPKFAKVSKVCKILPKIYKFYQSLKQSFKVQQSLTKLTKVLWSLTKTSKVFKKVRITYYQLIFLISLIFQEL